MNRDYFRRLYDYNYWGHRKLWASIIELSEEQFTHPHNYSIGSIHAQVVHTMEAEALWLSRLKGVSPTIFPGTEAYPTRAAIRARWDATEAEFRAFIDALNEDQLTQTLRYTTTKGEARQTQVSDLLMHVANHGTDHRAQILALLHQLGGKTFEQDALFYALEKPSL